MQMSWSGERRSNPSRPLRTRALDTSSWTSKILCHLTPQSENILLRSSWIQYFCLRGIRPSFQRTQENECRSYQSPESYYTHITSQCRGTGQGFHLLVALNYFHLITSFCFLSIFSCFILDRRKQLALTAALSWICI